jgi:hypothetical protein
MRGMGIHPVQKLARDLIGVGVQSSCRSGLR